MNCSMVRDLLSERLDAPLSASDERAVTTHLAACADCAETDRRLASLVEDLALLSDVETPAGLSDRVIARVAPPRLQASGPPRLAPRELRRVAGWAVIMLTASLSLLGRDFAGQLADGLAPVIARAEQEATRSRLSGTSFLGSLDARGEEKLREVTAGLRGSKQQESR